jgi:arginase
MMDVGKIICVVDCYAKLTGVLQGGRAEMGQTQMQSIRILGIPMDLGQQRRGVDMGPSAMRYAGLYERLAREGYLVEDLGNLDVPVRDERSVREHRWTTGEGGGLRHLPEVVATCQAIYEEAQKCADSGALPLFLGGDHSIAIGTVAGMRCGGRLGLLWVDAHGDFNTPETSPSGNIHGMPVATLVGRGQQELVDLGHAGPKLRPHDVVMIGIRDLDPEERAALANSGISVYTMRDVDELGMATVARRALARLGHVSRIHLSLDMDSIDPGVAPGVGTPVPGGLTFREAHLLMEIAGEAHKLASMDVVEINPILDDGNRTAELAVELVASVLGKRIL